MRRYQFISDYRHRYPVHTVATMCRALAVSRSGYYAWRGRPESQRSRARRCLLVEIKAVYEEYRQSYGSPRITEVLRARTAAAHIQCPGDLRDILALLPELLYALVDR